MHDNDDKILEGGKSCHRSDKTVALARQSLMWSVGWCWKHARFVSEVDDTDGLACEVGDHIHVDTLSHKINQGGFVKMDRDKRGGVTFVS